MKTIIGIDPGVNGAVSILDEAGHLINVFDIPVTPDGAKGRNAINELARQLDRISAFTELSRGLTVSAGSIGGGGKTNVIPAHAGIHFFYAAQRY